MAFTSRATSDTPETDDSDDGGDTQPQSNATDYSTKTPQQNIANTNTNNNNNTDYSNYGIDKMDEDDSDDDDYDAVDGQTMGGFHERNLDEHNNSKENSNNNVYNQQTLTNTSNDDHKEQSQSPQSQDNWVVIDYEGQLITIPLDSSIRTFRDIKSYLASHDDKEITSSHFLVDPESNYEYNDDDAAAIANHKTLVIRWNAFFLRIEDGFDVGVDIRVAEEFSIARIKELVLRNHNIRLETLSYEGNEMEPEQTLATYGITAQSGMQTLVSRISITIDDVQCEVSTEVLVCEFWDIGHVLDRYLQSERREKHKHAVLKKDNAILAMTDRVFDSDIRNGAKLEYFVGKYKVKVYDSDMTNEFQSSNDMQFIEVEVCDYHTIEDIKKSYALQARKPFLEHDKLLSNERQLEESVALWKLRIKDDEALLIEREQQQKPAEYICAECGSIVSLRPFDAVQCRECFHQIVYKKRTNRVCQYNCR